MKDEGKKLSLLNEEILFPVLVSGEEAFDAYGIQFVPTLVVIDNKNIIRLKYLGYNIQKTQSAYTA